MSSHHAQMRAHHQVSPAYLSTALPPTPLPNHSESSTSIYLYSCSEGSLTAEGHTLSHGTPRWTGENSADRYQSCQMTSIDTLPDEILLSIFDFYALDVWPALPLLIWDDEFLTEDLDNLTALLEQSDRVCQIRLTGIPNSHYLEKHLKAMQKPFPELTDLTLWSLYGSMPVIPDSFLGGSTPRLRKISLDRIPFPGLPKLLLSATNLVSLYLFGIPNSGYISPEAMVSALFTLTNLRSLYPRFQSTQSHPDRARRPLPPPKRSVLPVLTELKFKGISKYFEDFIAHIDAPQLSTLYISFFNQIEFGTPKLVQFIYRTPRLKELERALVFLEYGITRINLSSRTSGPRTLNVGIISTELNQHPLSLEQVFTSSLPLLSTLEDLYIHERSLSPMFLQRNIGVIQWPVLLRPFAAVKNLYLSEQFAPRIAPALQNLVGSSTTEVLPSLEKIFLEGLEPSGPAQEGITQFVAARQVTGHPIAVTRWEKHQEDYDNEGCDVDDHDADDGELDEHDYDSDDW